MKNIILSSLIVLITVSVFAQQYVDLGLPSGTLWKDQNENGLYTYQEAEKSFGKVMPTAPQLIELVNFCTWEWTGAGYKITGPNGKSIVFPAEGYYTCGNDPSVKSVGEKGQYWSKTVSDNSSIAFPEWKFPYCLSVSSESKDVHFNNPDCCKFSVRLVSENETAVSKAKILQQLSESETQAIKSEAEEQRKREEELRKEDDEERKAHPQTFTVNGASFMMRCVKGGTFNMGCTSEQGDECAPQEKPVHRVTVSDFYIGETEVTQELWKAVMGTEPDFKGGWTDKRGRGNDYPAYYVSWDDCQEFIQKLNEQTGKTFRLPTEAEWEYAARGGNRGCGYKFAGSNNYNDVAWYCINLNSGTHPVKKKLPNELGLYDMSGNVYEWCQDWKGLYNSSAQTNPTGSSSGSWRVYRGGSVGDYGNACRVALRNGYKPSSRSYFVGLRLVLTPCDCGLDLLTDEERASRQKTIQENQARAAQAANKDQSTFSLLGSLFRVTSIILNTANAPQVPYSPGVGNVPAATSGSDSYNSSSSSSDENNTPTKSAPRICTTCNGTGKVIKDSGAPQFGLTRKYCDICQKEVAGDHIHGQCPVCRGKGHM